MNFTLRAILSCILILFILLILTGCKVQEGTTGYIGEWLRGKALSVKVDILSNQMNKLVYPTIRNESETEVSISPINLVVWFSHSGKLKREITLKNQNTGKSTTIHPKKEFPGLMGVFEFGPEVGSVEKVRDLYRTRKS